MLKYIIEDYTIILDDIHCSIQDKAGEKLFTGYAYLTIWKVVRLLVKKLIHLEDKINNCTMYKVKKELEEKDTKIKGGV